MSRNFCHLMISLAMIHPNTQAAPPVMRSISERMNGFVEGREIAGAVTLVADADHLLHLAADGLADIGQDKPMAKDSIFWIASMTKPITATAVMMMQEEKKLSVDDPVSKYLPEFQNLKDADGKSVSITLKQCLTHSSGLSDLSGEETKGMTTLKETMSAIVAKPTIFAPGSKWQYCQTGINTVARVVEVVAGKAFPEFLQERLFDPLGMVDTSFYPTDEQASRIASSYKRDAAGGLEKAALFFLDGARPSLRNRPPMANGGLFSTAGDYAKFAQMILRGGEFGGKRYLSGKSVSQMTSVQSGDLVTGFTPGNAWGLGWCIARDPQGVSAALSRGSMGHGGMFGTQAWIDPVKKRIYLLMIQRADIGNSDGSEIRRSFQEVAAQP